MVTSEMTVTGQQLSTTHDQINQNPQQSEETNNQRKPEEVVNPLKSEEIENLQKSEEIESVEEEGFENQLQPENLQGK